MAQTSTLLSASITNANATPVVENTTGMGAQGRVIIQTDYCTPISADAAGSSYRLVRFPTTAKVKSLWLWSAIASAGSGDIDIAYSNSATDGTQAALAAKIGVGIPTTYNKLFGSAQSLVLSSVWVDFTSKGTFTCAMQNIPMWQNLVTLGCTDFDKDPGGFFDIYILITTAVTTGGVLGAQLTYVL